MEIQTYVVVQGGGLLYARDLGKVHYDERPRPGDPVTIDGDEYVVALVAAEPDEVVGAYVTAFPPTRAPAPAPTSAG